MLSLRKRNKASNTKMVFSVKNHDDQDIIKFGSYHYKPDKASAASIA